jgi:hypothetical protein
MIPAKNLIGNLANVVEFLTNSSACRKKSHDMSLREESMDHFEWTRYEKLCTAKSQEALDDDLLFYFQKMELKKQLRKFKK